MITEANANIVKAKQRRRIRINNNEALAGYAFITPIILFFLVFSLGPFLFTIYVSFHDWNMLTPVSEMPYVGFNNYRYILHLDPLFKTALGNTIIFSLGNVVITMVFSLCLAVLLNTKILFRSFWRAAFFLPYVTSSVAVAIVWSNIYHPSFGLLNGILAYFHVPAQGYISDPKQAMASLITVAVWQGLGYWMIVLLAGLQGISKFLYEAAEVDGAGFLDKLFYITIPSLRPTLLFVAVVSTLGSLQTFDLPFILTGGGPINMTYTLVMEIYEIAFKFFRMGRASAVAVVLFLLTFTMTLVQLRMIQGKE